MAEPQSTPARIVEPNGHVHVGWFAQPFEVANLREALPDHALSGLAGGAFDMLERSFRRMRLKEWQYVSVVTPKALFACAVVDVGYIGSGFAYVVERGSGKRHEWSIQAPLGRGVTVARSSIAGTSRIERPDWGHIEIYNDSASQLRRLSVRLNGELGAEPKPALKVQLDLHDDLQRIQPVVVVEPCAPGHWLYTHKSYGLPAVGMLHCGELLEELALGEALAGFDYNSGYRERRTWWNWAAAAGHATDGTPLGFNLTAHRPWDAQGSQRGDEPDAADCGIWIDGELTKIERVEFDYQPADLMQPWRIRDAEGLVDLRFSPMGERSEDINFGVLASQFHQPYGPFSGTLQSRSGRRVELASVFGVTEQHYALW